jgi:hypothetical protein
MATKRTRAPTKTSPPTRKAAVVEAAGETKTITSVERSADPFAQVNRQRIPLSIDPLGDQSADVLDQLLPLREKSLTRIYAGMQQIQTNLTQISKVLGTRTSPTTLVGTLTQANGAAASHVQVQYTPATGKGIPVVTTTAEDGGFTLSIPPGMPLPDEGLNLQVHGADGNASLLIPAAQIASNGLVGSPKLSANLAPLPKSILASLAAIATPPSPANSVPEPPTTQLHSLKLGEDGQCAITFAANPSIDTFSYGVFFRLVEPRMSIVQEVVRKPITDTAFLPLPVYATASRGAFDATRSSYVDRVPVEQPLSADGFRDQLMGLTPNGTIVADETVPMAATLGLGYMLTLSQRWTYLGVSLGDLLYSLPLAPGEQQQIAIFERSDTSQVTESEFFSQDETEQQTALSDTSAQSTFDSAFHEMSQAGSHFSTTSVSASVGFSFIGFGGGAGTSSTTGDSSEWLQGQRDSTQQASEATHSAAARQASARRSAMRTGMRMASATESQSVTTKTITNHNHTRALTMQYWEVLRMFDVTTAIDGLTLTCLVPMQIVRFLPPGQPATLAENAIPVSTRDGVLKRYASVLKHADVLAQAMPRAFQYGLTLVRQFAADPTATVEPAGGTAEDVVAISLSGRFAPCEDIYVSAVTRRYTRIGPVRLTPSTTFEITPNAYTSQDALVASLQASRNGGSVTFQGSLALPPSLNRSDVVGFEISRGFRRVDYTLKQQGNQAADDLVSIFGAAIAGPLIGPLLEGSGVATSPPTTVHLSPTDLERALGGPELVYFSARIEDLTGQPNQPSETYANESLQGTILPVQPLPVPALQVGPVLRYNEVLEIEKMTQHVVRNTTEYSRAVWSSLTSDERAILLDAYTIGVSPGGIQDESQMVPLLNCVQNRLLGFFGNSMILPFMIPQSVADAMKIDPAKIQQNLLAYQQATFTPPHSVIALPTRGVLGEAVLGHCPSAEKIDLTRFWNWQDSPSDVAPTIAPVTLPTTSPSLTTGLAAPNSLTNLTPLINNVISAPSADTSLAQALGQVAAAQKDFDPNMTGAAQLATAMTGAQTAANSARQDALKSATDTQMMAMAIAGNLVGGMYGGNPTAGSSAASAITGKGSTAAPKAKKATDSKGSKKSADSKSKNSDDTSTTKPDTGDAPADPGDGGGDTDV